MFTANFKSSIARQAKFAGGKGSSLAKMTQAGLSVPPGFIVLSSAFQKFLTENNLVKPINKIIQKTKVGNFASIKKSSKQIRKIIQSSEVPAGIKSEIEESFRLLRADFVAVRSSATAEDGKENSWAGELETFLNIRGNNLLKSIKSCWASLYTERAITYSLGISRQKAHISVAVVVQKMVQSEIAGVSFSVNPVSANANEIVIEAGLGLGEVVVAGLITPDNYIIDKKTLKILSATIGEQKFKILQAKGKNIRKLLTSAEKSKLKLSTQQIVKLSKIIKSVEKYFKAPQDIEWAYENGKFYLTQSRPVTTL